MELRNGAVGRMPFVIEDRKKKKNVRNLTFILCIIGISAAAQNGNYLTPYTAEDTLKAPPMTGHRWKTNMVPQYVMEPIPTPATYWCFHPSGSLSTAGHYSSDAEALTACGSGSQAFLEGHDAIIKRDETTGEFSILWQFKAGFHSRIQQVMTNYNVVGLKTNDSLHPTAPPMPTLPVSKPAAKARVIPVIAPSPVRGSTTVSVSGPPGTPVPIIWGWAKGAYLEDCVTENMVTNAIGVLFQTVSNTTYRVWCAGRVSGPWTEYPMSGNVQPATTNSYWAHCLPLPTDGGQRFYQITSSNP